MGEHNDLGKKGEVIAVNYLKHKGYSIIAVNWRYRHKEIDIVARDKDFLVIVEVKTRKNNSCTLPEESVNTNKKRHLVNAAEVYIMRNKIDLETRFDIISIGFDIKGKPEIRHIKEAFHPSAL